MSNTDFESLARLLQLSVGPVVLISGVGLLLLSVMNRLGRAVDHARNLTREWNEKPYDARLALQVDKQIRRCSLLRYSIGCIVLSILMSSLIILGLIGMVFFKAPIAIAVLALLVASIMFIVAAAVFLLVDVTLALQVLRLEVPLSEQEQAVCDRTDDDDAG